ncbi:MAG: glycoside hydrolase family 65 protein, partial [Bacteroidota bacterium]|nr:glycoside hydrolase family 65 protein [Bacteroidota bacterium]
MNQDYIKADSWSIIEEGFDHERVKSSESLFSIGNGAMGQRANFEEHYSGETFQGSYIAGVYYPDKTRVGWWKNGYPEYFAKVLNAPNWIGINIAINQEPLDLNTCTKVENFRRELNMKEGWYKRSFVATMPNGLEVAVEVVRFLSLSLDETGAIQYTLQVLNADAVVSLTPYVDGGITNMDSNWADKFWNITNITSEGNRAFVNSHTMKTNFSVCTFMQAEVFVDGEKIEEAPELEQTETLVGHTYNVQAGKNETITLIKFGGYTVDRNHPKDKLTAAANSVLDKATELGF